ncbi:MAG: right-handed parallel beta-helix repeat-containing protein [Planctomycetota bacterium]
MAMVAAVSLMLFITSIYAAVINVPGDEATISAAIAAANPGGGDTIKVAAGTYTDTSQVVIDRDVTIRGASSYTTIIKKNFNTASSGNDRGWWLVEDGHVLHLSRVTMDGSDSLTWQAIRHRGTGTIKYVKFIEIKFNESVNYAGVAVAAFGTGPVDITRCRFSEIGRIGVLYFGPGVNGSTFAYNKYTGKGDGDWLDYGVEFGAGAQGTVKYNTISGNRGVASSDGSTSAGILTTTFFGAGTDVTIKGNWLYRNTTGIADGYGDADTTVLNVSYNKIFKNTSNGVHLRSDGNTLKRNYAWRNGGNGFDVDAESIGNVFTKNRSFINTGYGYNDESSGSGDGGTGNTYVGNWCLWNGLGGSNPSGLCGPQL